MRSAFALDQRRYSRTAFATAMACQPKPAAVPTSEGSTTDKFVAAVYRTLQEKK